MLENKGNNMNIYAKEFDKVKYTGVGGYDHHKELGDKHLEVGTIYEVDHTEVYNWHTDVILKGFENLKFNSVLFEDV